MNLTAHNMLDTTIILFVPNTKQSLYDYFQSPACAQIGRRFVSDHGNYQTKCMHESDKFENDDDCSRLHALDDSYVEIFFRIHYRQ